MLLHAATINVLVRTPAATALWAERYTELKAERPGLLGKLLSRGAAHAARLAGLFALCDRSAVVDVPHLEAALAWWDFCAQSAAIIFADRSGNENTDRIYAEMVPGEVMTQSELRQKLWSGHITSGALRDAIVLAQALGYVRVDAQDTGGRPAHVVTRLKVE